MTIGELLERYEDRLGSELFIKSVTDETFGYRWSIQNEHGEEILIAASEHQLIEALLGALNQDLPDTVDFIEGRY